MISLLNHASNLETRVASQAAWYRMENGPKSKNGKKWPNNRKWPSARIWEKMAQKWRKKSQNDPPNPIFGPFFPHFGPRAISIFGPIFSPFLDFGPFSILYQAAWLARQGGKSTGEMSKNPVKTFPEIADFRDCLGFHDFCESRTQLLVCSCLSCLRRFRDFCRFRARWPACKP